MIIKQKTRQLLQQALKEDIASGDITTLAIISKNSQAKFVIIAKEPCVLCGVALAEAGFEIVDKDIHFRAMAKDADNIQKGKVIAHIQGNSQKILTAERTALNFLGWLSGVATITNRFVNAVKKFNVQIFDTRKTLPGLRSLQKYAVRMGGGKNHRMGLYDQILIKDNHLSVISNQPSVISKKSSAIKEAIERARKHGPKNTKIEIEVKNLAELKEALMLCPDIIMLDNMSIDCIEKAVQLRNSHRIKQQDLGFKTLLEVSGNVSLENVVKIAQTGIERISIGALTHSAPAIDFSLKAK